MLTAGIVMTALLALLAFAPLASAASNPVSTSSTATVTINKGFKKGLSKKGVTILRVSPAKLKGAKLTFKATGGSIDPATGKGTVNLGGGIKFKAGKKNAVVKKLVLNNTKSVLGAKLTGNVGGKNMVFATIVGLKSTPNGFGNTITIKQLKLSGKAAGQLNKKLGLKGKHAAFKGNKVMGSAKTEVQPSTVTVKAGGVATLAPDATTLGKFASKGVNPLTDIKPIQGAGVVAGPAFTFPISGGTISPAGTAGILQTSGGLEIAPAGKPSTTFVNLFADFGVKVITAEVTILPSPPAPGALGRISIADIDLAGGSFTSDPATHTVTVTNANIKLQAVAAATLNQVYPGGTDFAPGDSLGKVSFSVNTE